MVYHSAKEEKERSFYVEKDRTLCETRIRNMVRQKKWKSSPERTLTTFKQQNKGLILT